MPEQRPTDEEWRALYAAAARFKAAEPWEWMEETDVFGVQNPETGELGFVSIMGQLGEHHALALYLGAEGLYSLWQFEEIASESPERFFEIPQMQASFEDRNELRKEDRDIIKTLGLKFRGRHAWPMFRSYRPGYAPWFVMAAEARFLTIALEQAIDVALRFKEDPSLLDPADDESYLVRVPVQADGTGWEDQWMRVAPPEAKVIEISVDRSALEQLHRMQQRKLNIQIDLFLAPGIIQANKDERPSLAYVLLSVDAKDGFILGVEVLSPHPSVQQMWGEIPGHVATILLKNNVVPTRISVRSDLLGALLKPLADQLDIHLVRSESLGRLDQAKESFFQWFR